MLSFKTTKNCSNEENIIAIQNNNNYIFSPRYYVDL